VATTPPQASNDRKQLVMKSHMQEGTVQTGPEKRRWHQSVFLLEMASEADDALEIGNDVSYQLVKQLPEPPATAAPL
jgi:hypothetical protein